MFFLRKFFISIFITIHLLILITAGFPDQSALGAKVLGYLRPIQHFFGLDQNWSMFAPNPASRNSFLDAVITFKDRSTEKWTFPRTSQMSGLLRFTSGERLRKYSQENLVAGEKLEMWYDLAHFLQREVEQIENKGQRRKIEEIHFFKHISAIKSPYEKFVIHGKQVGDFKVESVFVFRPDEKAEI